MMKRAEAEEIGIGVLNYVAGEPELLTRFLELTGVTPATLRDAVRAPGFFVSILDFVLYDDATVMAAANRMGVKPEDIVSAREALAPHGEFG
ncbi:MAG: DUF3572 domain-containing protein [Methylobacteriaceae bacterium]|jgi:hypothetical protein|nr:DUF3572 domain-containing protein [Methylobacteriaceae bacterium]